MPEPVVKGKAMSQRQRDIVETRLRTQTPHELIKDEIGCSLIQIRKMSAIFNRFGTVTLPVVRKQGRPRALTDEHVQVRSIDLIVSLLCYPSWTDF